MALRTNLTDVRIGGMKLEGARQLQRLLRTLPGKAQRRVFKKAHKEAGKVIVKAAKARVPKRAGLLKKSLFAHAKRLRRDNNIMAVIIGPRRRFHGTFEGKETTASKYAHLVEKGSATMPARPFLRPALASSSGEALRVLGVETGKGITKEALKLRGKK